MRLVSLMLTMPDRPVTAVLDPYHVEPIAPHLVSDALKFAEAGEVTIGVRTAEGNVVLWGDDPGIGVDPAFQPRMFDEFAAASPGSCFTVY